MPRIASLLTLCLLHMTGALAAPVASVEGGYSNFRLEQDDIGPGVWEGYSSYTDKILLESHDAAYLKGEVAWPVGGRMAVALASTFSYSTDGEEDQQEHITTPGVSMPAGLDYSPDHLYNLSSGVHLRWTQPLTSRLVLHADAGGSSNYWRYDFTRDVLELDLSSSPGLSRFVIRKETFRDSDAFFALDASLGASMRLADTLDLTTDYGLQRGSNYHNHSFSTGLRYRFN